MIFTTSSSIDLAKKISKLSKEPFGQVEIGQFSDGETMLRVREDVKGKAVIAISTTAQPATNVLEFLILLNALKESGAKKITAVIPYFGYSKSDHYWDTGTPLTAKLMAELIERAGAHKIITINLHNKIIKTFFTQKITDINCLEHLARAVKKKVERKNIVIASPDKGGVDRAKKFAKVFEHKTIIALQKFRPDHDIAKIVDFEADLKGKTVIIVDDMIQTGGTIIEAATKLKAQGAKKVIVAAVHLVVSAGGYKKISQAKKIDKVFISNSISTKSIKLSSKFKVIDISELITKEV